MNGYNFTFVLPPTTNPTRTRSLERRGGGRPETDDGRSTKVKQERLVSEIKGRREKQRERRSERGEGRKETKRMNGSSIQTKT